MPDNGQGVFQRAYSWVADAAQALGIQPPRLDADANDIAGALTNRICRDGQAPPTADIPWGGRKITGLGNPVNPGDAVNLLTLSSVAADGCCQLSVADQNTLQLLPKDGNALYINGTTYHLPSSLTVSASGLSNNTLYYVYAIVLSGAPALAISATGYTFDAAGRAILQGGDATHRLVGKFATNAYGLLEDDAGFRGCASYFNRRRKQATVQRNTQPTTSPNLAALYSVSVYFLTWPDEAVTVRSAGTIWSNTAGTISQLVNTVDGAVVGQPVSAYMAAANGYLPVDVPVDLVVNDGLHALNAQGAVNGGTGSFQLTNSAVFRA